MKSLYFTLLILCNISDAMIKPNENKFTASYTCPKQDIKSNIKNIKKRSYCDSVLYSKEESLPSLNLVKQTQEEMQSKNDINDGVSNTNCFNQSNNKRRKLLQDYKSKSVLSNIKTYDSSENAVISVLMSEISESNLKLSESNSELEKLQTNNTEITLKIVKLKKHLNSIMNQYNKILSENSLSREESENFQKKLENLQNELDKSQKKSENLQNQVKELLEELNEYRKNDTSLIVTDSEIHTNL